MAIREPIRSPLHSAAPDWDKMSDEQVIAYYQNQSDVDKFHVPAHMVPDGMAYQWIRLEVIGKPDPARIAQVQMNGWQPVEQMRHDGFWMAPGTPGPVILDGMGLYELPMRLYRLRREAEARRGMGAVRAMNEQMQYAPPGTGPRGTHQFTQPVVRSERGATEIVVE